MCFSHRGLSSQAMRITYGTFPENTPFLFLAHFSPKLFLDFLLIAGIFYTLGRSAPCLHRNLQIAPPPLSLFLAFVLSLVSVYVTERSILFSCDSWTCKALQGVSGHGQYTSRK